MNPDELKRLLLAMGARAPELKLAIRDILDYLEENGTSIVTSSRAVMSYIPEKYEDIDFKPPNSVADAAKKGLEYRRKQEGDKAGLTTEEAGDAGIGSGVQRAVNLKNRDELEPDTIKQMHGFFARHEDNKDIDEEHKGTPWEDNGYVSWLLWGGDPGKQWVDKIMKEMKEADKKAKESRIANRVASMYLRLSYLPNISGTMMGKLKKGIERFARNGLTPFPSSNPQRILSKLADQLIGGVEDDLPSGYSLNPKQAFHFLTRVVGLVDIGIKASDLDDVLEEVLGSPDPIKSSAANRIEAALEKMLEELADNPSGGMLRTQEKAVRLISRLVAASEYEAQQILDKLVGVAEFKVDFRSDQLNGLLGSYLTEPSKAANIRHAKDLPKSVERYVEEHKEQGMDEEKAWAIAWSRYCQYKEPNSPHCKQDDYFKGRETHVEVAERYFGQVVAGIVGKE